ALSVAVILSSESRSISVRHVVNAAAAILDYTPLLMNSIHEFSATELRKLRSLKNPHGIQRFIDDMPYRLADTAWSPQRVLRENTAHCFEGAMLAAAALRANGYPPLIFDLEADKDTDHVVAIYRRNGHWGAIAKSNYTGCRYRDRKR